MVLSEQMRLCFPSIRDLFAHLANRKYHRHPTLLNGT
jgi:hypothetical protein